MSNLRGAGVKPALRRQFLTHGGRQTHYRHGGRGAPVVVIHAPPFSSQILGPALESLARRYGIIAPDLPGYGASDPLPPGAEPVAGSSEALLDFLDRLELGPCHIIAEGAAAHLALAMVQRRPDRFVSFALGHLHPPSTPAAGYPIFRPAWDGAHLVTLWAFLKEFHTFRPWDQPARRHRCLGGLPSTAFLHDALVAMLNAPGLGRGYASLLEASDGLSFDFNSVTQHVPVLVYGVLARRDWFPESGVECFAAESEAELHGALEAFLARHPCPAGPVSFPGVEPLPGALASRMIDVPGGQLHLRFNVDAGGRPAFVQHDAASSTRTVEPLAQRLVGERAVFALDMPGSGRSDDLLGNHESIDLGPYADALLAALDALGFECIDFYGMWGGGFVGTELAYHHPERIAGLAISNLFAHEGEELRQFQQHYTPSVEPDVHGAYLMQCWHQMRDQGLFYPWFDKSPAGVIDREPFLDPDMVHERVCSLLAAGNRYRTAYQAHFVYPIRERLAAIRVPTVLGTADWDPNFPHTEAIAAEVPESRLVMMSPDFSRWALDLLVALEA